MQHRKNLVITLAAMMVITGTSLAETVSFNGTVVASGTHEIYAPIGGTIDQVCVEAGQYVTAGDTLFQLSTTKVYAEESGTVTGIFAQPGDNAETIAQKYGGVLYIEGESVYTIAASTENAYDTTANKFVSVGEQVNLSCYSDNKHTGTGTIISIEGTDYNIEVKSGEFLIGETVNVYRGEAKVANRIGRGTLHRKNPLAVCGNGSIVSIAVNSGDRVNRGDLLFETLDGSFDGLYMSGSSICTDTSGTVASLRFEQGTKVEKNNVAAVIYPEYAMRIKGQISESDLSYISEGDTVEIELIWNQDDEVTYSGTVSMISSIAAQTDNSEMNDGETVFDVYVDFKPDENTRFGMNAIINTIETPLEATSDETYD